MVTPTSMHSDEKASKLVLKNEFLARAKSLSKLPEVYRGPRLTLLLAEALAIGIRAEAEFLLATYGDSSGREYWHAQLSEPILLYKFAYTLAVHAAERVEQLEQATIAIIWSFRDAAEGGEDWFIGDTTPLLVLENRQRSFENLGRIKVYPRAAVTWLLSKPRRVNLVPECLRTFLQFNSTLGRTRHLTKKAAERFVDDFINDEQGQGRRPNMESLEKAAKKAGFRGGRDHLRAAFRCRIESRRGRPSKDD
jgi:hypothetical protein